MLFENAINIFKTREKEDKDLIIKQYLSKSFNLPDFR